MGNTICVSKYAAEISAPSDPSKETGVFRSIEALKKLVDIPKGLNNSWDLFQRSVKAHGECEMLGHRKLDAAGNAGAYEWLTYDEVSTAARSAGAFLRSHDLCPLNSFEDESFPTAREMRCIGLFLTNRPEWFITEYACASQNIAIVPLYETLGSESMNYIVDLTKLSTIVVSKATFSTAIKAASHCELLRNFVLVDALSLEQEAEAAEAGVNVYRWEDVISAESTGECDAPTNPDAINTLCFTSGTTGMPKGVIVTHRNVVACSYSTSIHGPLSSGEMLGIDHNDVHISYLPLAHVFERLVCSVVVSVAGHIGCYSGNMLKLMDDVAALNPTVFISVPRLFNRINDKISAGVDQKGVLLQSLFEWGLNSKITKFRNSATTTSAVWDTVVFGRFKGLLGNRLRFMVSGGAPLDPKVHERIQACFCAPLLQGYGMSETFGPSFLCSDSDTVLGHVGGVYPSVEFKLESVPELGYMANESVPKGELLIRGNSITSGYFRNPKANEEHFKDGWLHTGDICALLPSNGVKIIDRKKNLFKLAQGEYVAPEKVENTLGNSPYVNQIFVHGDSTQSFLVAVVVADHDKARMWASSRSPGLTDVNEIVKMPEFKAELLSDLAVTATSSGLQGFEKIKNCLILANEFTVENNLLTPTSKLKRAIAKKHFADELDALYAEGIIKFN
eukprot:GHVH01005046.1.p1 GENE.GHVH01005046.1~~GHVH01005046.1.p1  ORF type:complete len:677 (+),score=89.98 GHVH01005046.1:111-2141(+)